MRCNLILGEIDRVYGLSTGPCTPVTLVRLACDGDVTIDVFVVIAISVQRDRTFADTFLALDLLLDLGCRGSFCTKEAVLLTKLVGREVIRIALRERDRRWRTLDDAFDFEVSCDQCYQRALVYVQILGLTA